MKVCQFKCITFLLLLCGLIGWIVSAEISLRYQKLIIDNFSDYLLFFFFMPMIETALFNVWLQQGVTDFGVAKKIALVQIRTSAVLISAFAFALAHLAVVGWWVFAWFIVGLALSLLWEITRSFWFVAGIHAYWNISLWLHN